MLLKKAMFLLLLMSSGLSAHADFSKALIGEWDSFDGTGIENKYLYLEIKQDNSGVFSLIRSGSVHVYDFKPEDSKLRDGFLEIKILDNQKEKRVLAVSAWDIESRSLLTGQLFFYEKLGRGKLNLFNTRKIRMHKKYNLNIIDDIELFFEKKND